MTVARRFVVHGKVQGVGFRYFTITCAEALAVTGWVRNLPEGTVEVHAEGTEGQLQELAFDLARGPRYARVTKVDAEDAMPGNHTGFFQLRA